jgi:uncharacterized membrane protein
MTDNFMSNLDDTLLAQYEYTSQMRRSHMYEFILLFIIAVFVLVITIKNLTSDTATTAGQVICWVILIWFVVAVVIYLARWIDSINLPSISSSVGSNAGPVIRIHYI